MILLAACYTLFNFRYFSFKDEERRQIMCARQNQAMFLNHLLAYLIIYLKTEDLRVVAFYLAQVSEQFQRSRNVASYFNRDPFSLEKRVKPSDPLYKLRFAEEMSRLESDMRHAADPNVRAESMLRYARGMQNSVGDNCWVLTSYYRGEWYGYPFYGQNQRRLAEEIVAESRKLKEKAFSLFTDDERAAKAYQDWCMWATAVKKYPDTKTSKRIRGHCDNLVDYQLSPSLAYRDRYD